MLPVWPAVVVSLALPGTARQRPVAQRVYDQVAQVIRNESQTIPGVPETRVIILIPAIPATSGSREHLRSCRNDALSGHIVMRSPTLPLKFRANGELEEA